MEVTGAVTQTSVMGTFTRVGTTQLGRSLYQLRSKVYLYHIGRSWTIGPDYSKTAAWVYAPGSNTLDAHLVPPGSWKEHSTDDGWQANSAIAVRCTMTAGVCFAAAQSLQACRSQPCSLRATAQPRPRAVYVAARVQWIPPRQSVGGVVGWVKHIADTGSTALCEMSAQSR